ncbi:cell surface protein [Furfurilactobacillus rossiae]|uniref:L,D-transpeptidase n=1 Tax=Furfurilactobacillus rossiae TaxID=231049 RepID=UPI0015BF68A7|nr:L,D-transpeptidase [Furfurilactobacillus rossiae]MCF6166771.1 L,D-transpeptidase [Furfurilactobacillus rossiae]QLE63781.1 cell surface protein [Furfurilactobacillus rossiae]
MSIKLKHMLVVVFIIFTVSIVGNFAKASFASTRPQSSLKSEKVAKSKTVNNKKKSSETVATTNKPYPNLVQYPQAWILVSLKHQRVYIMNGKQRLYTMLASTGMHDSTPTGTFHVEAERGTYFYAPKFNEGAYDWVSWKDHGVYLFHSTPTDEQKHILPGPEADLGKRPSSHGCVHLSIPDARWVYETIPTGTTVKIVRS